MSKYVKTSAEEEFFLALESVLRWTNRQGYPHEKIRAIRKVAETALMRTEQAAPKTWTPSYLTVVPDTEEN